ncbi:MAG TPA: regulatory signaling modulator protein AmpE [Gammaproteobacteria bacterium]|nr:regulatory signaling modulator protein AmpE [Gammaproteobacteria bacterium]
MTFIIVFVALIIERFFHWTHLRHWRWFTRYERWLSVRLNRLPAALILAIGIVPILFVVWLIERLVSGWFFGVAQLIFGAFVLLYCLGPNNLWFQVYRCLNGLNKEDPNPAMQEVEKAFGVSAATHLQAFHQAFVRKIFVAAHERIFAVLFWFVLLGPVGAVLYRLADVCSEESALGFSAMAAQFQRLLDWIPVRLFTFIFALGGHFKDVFAHWKQHALRGLNENTQLLTECGIAALNITEGGVIPEGGSAEKEALELLDRVFVMALVMLAVIVLLT